MDMEKFFKVFIILVFIYIFLSAIVFFVPIGKWQSSYMKFMRDFRNLGVRHYNYELIKAGELEQPAPRSQTSNPDNRYRKPLYIRDKNNPKILHKYVEEQ